MWELLGLHAAYSLQAYTYMERTFQIWFVFESTSPLTLNLRDLTKVEEIPMNEYLTLLLRPLSKLKSSLHRVRTSFEALPGFPLAIAGSWPKNPGSYSKLLLTLFTCRYVYWIVEGIANLCLFFLHSHNAGKKAMWDTNTCTLKETPINWQTILVEHYSYP